MADQELQTPRFARGMIVAVLPGIPVYLAQRRHMTQPAPVPPYR
jgi:hypothetical protein